LVFGKLRPNSFNPPPLRTAVWPTLAKLRFLKFAAFCSPQKPIGSQPAVPLPVHSLSKRAHSTTLSPLQ